MSSTKTIKLTKTQSLRKSLTQTSINVEERLSQNKPCRLLELALHRAVNAKLDQNPRFAWR